MNVGEYRKNISALTIPTGSTTNNPARMQNFTARALNAVQRGDGSLGSFFLWNGFKSTIRNQYFGNTNAPVFILIIFDDGDKDTP